MHRDVEEVLTGGQVAVRTGTLVAIDLFSGWSDVRHGGELWCVLQPRSLTD